MKILGYILLLIFSSCYSDFGSDEGSEFKVFDLGADLSFESLFDSLLSHKCLKCHAWASEEGEVNSRLVPGRPDLSSLYTSIEGGEMPQGGPELNPQEKDFVYAYIMAQEPEPVTVSLKIDSELLEKVKAEILMPKCYRCHKWMKRDPRILSRIKIGRPEESRLYLRVIDNSMPIAGPPLSDEEKQAILNLVLGVEEQ